MVDTGWCLEKLPEWYHNFAMVDVVSELMDRGYTCYVEEAIPKDEKHNVHVDIYGLKQNKEVIVEIGFLDQQHKGDRLKLLHTLKPDAKIVHVTTLQNWRQLWQMIEDEENRMRKFEKWYHEHGYELIAE